VSEISENASRLGDGRGLEHGHHGTDPQAATLEIVRDAPDDVQDRWVRLSFDEAPEEILRYGETMRRRLAPGRHRIKAHNTLSWDTLELDLAPGQSVRVRCHNHFARGGVLTMLTIGFAFIKVRLEVVGA
jgi:hypothetical protein